MVRRLTLLAAVALLAIACVTNKVTGRKSVVLVPQSIMMRLGAQGYADVQQQLKESDDARATEIVRRVAFRIAATTGAKFDWEVKLLVDPAVNAYVFPGGKIVVNTGILPVCQDEASLAVVLGHECAHAIARHGAERMTQTMLIEGGLIAADLTMEDGAQKPGIMAALGAGAQVGVLLPFSRTHESEADEMGLRYMAMAGYDPNAGPELWDRFSAGQEEPDEFLSTHPNSSTRAEALRSQLPKVLPLYEAAPEKYGRGERLVP